MPQRFDEQRMAEYNVLRRKVGERIKQARTEDGFTQEDIATRLGRSISWLSFIERGTNMPNLLDLISISRVLGRPLDFFVSDWEIVTAMRAPRNEAEWRTMFPAQPDRAAAHASIDRNWKSVDEIMRARARMEAVG